MKSIIYALSTFAIIGATPFAAQAADLDGYEGGYVDRGPVVERRYYEDAPVVTYYAPRVYRPYPYYSGYYGYPAYGYWGGRRYWGARYAGRPYWRHHGYWGGHRGWR
jgi:hypothetical protein